MKKRTINVFLWSILLVMATMTLLLTPLLLKPIKIATRYVETGTSATYVFHVNGTYTKEFLHQSANGGFYEQVITGQYSCDSGKVFLAGGQEFIKENYAENPNTIALIVPFLLLGDIAAVVLIVHENRKQKRIEKYFDKNAE